MLNLSTLNPQQRQAVETIKGPVLILAGAGTGKTRVITCRIAFMVQRGIEPGRILGVTFTNKAAREMRERVGQLVPRTRAAAREGSPTPRESMTLCTFHSLCVRILRVHIEKLGYKRNFVIYDQSEQVGAVRKILAQIHAKGEKLDPAGVLGQLSRLRNAGERAGALADDDLRAIARHIRPRYESALRACNAVDFDDLILLTLRLFQEHPDALAACRAKYQYVMVDEYQDTNAAQFQLVHALTREHRNLCVVGDDDQSIYGWRGAEISNLLDMEKHFPEVKVIKLEQNYRSTNTILGAANAVITHNVRRRGKKLWSQQGEGAKIALYAFTTEDEEGRTIAEKINFASLARQAAWSDHAILFRTNGQSRALEIAMRQAGVRYHVVGGQSFFDRREVRDFLAYLKMLLNPNDDISLLRIANVPARGLSDVTMERLLGASHERSCSVFSAMKNPVVVATFQAPARGAIERFVEFIERTREPLHRPTALAAWAQHFLDETRYFEEIRRAEKTQDASENRIRNVKEMVATLEPSQADAASSGFDRLQTFLEEVTLDTEREEEEDAGNAVTLITMHSCKGLEFPHVFIVGMEEGLLPHERSKAEGTLDEERRLFYVAITRAMKTLTISHCAARKRYGQAMPCHPSRFLLDLPEEFVEHGDEGAKRPVPTTSSKPMFDVLRAATD